MTSPLQHLSGVLCPYDARGKAEPLTWSLPHSSGCALRISHPLSALLPASPSGLVSCRWRPWGFPFRAFPSQGAVPPLSGRCPPDVDLSPSLPHQPAFLRETGQSPLHTSECRPACLAIRPSLFRPSRPRSASAANVRVGPKPARCRRLHDTHRSRRPARAVGRSPRRGRLANADDRSVVRPSCTCSARPGLASRMPSRQAPQWKHSLLLPSSGAEAPGMASGARPVRTTPATPPSHRSSRGSGRCSSSIAEPSGDAAGFLSGNGLRAEARPPPGRNRTAPVDRYRRSWRLGSPGRSPPRSGTAAPTPPAM
jgi:hypothetical protein